MRERDAMADGYWTFSWTTNQRSDGGQTLLRSFLFTGTFPIQCVHCVNEPANGFQDKIHSPHREESIQNKMIIADMKSHAAQTLLHF